MKLINKLISMIVAIVVLINVMLVITSAESDTLSALSVSVDGVPVPGSGVTVKFMYSDIAGFDGTVTFSNPDIISSVTGEVSGIFGIYNPDTGLVYAFSNSAANPTFELKIILASNAPIGSTCEVTFEYATTSPNGELSDTQYDYATITVQKPIDYTELHAQINRATPLKKSDYTADSWSAMTSALNAAKRAKNSTSQTTVDTATANLKAAIDNLVKVSTAPSEVDYTYLQSLITKAEKLNEEDYTASSWGKLESALANAKSALDSKSQKDVNLAASKLADAIEALRRIIGIDYTALNALIKAGVALNAKDYTSESWSVFISALADAKAALDSDDQAVVDEKAAALKSAMDALVKINYDALRDALSKIEEFKSKNGNLTGLWDKLNALIEKAEELLNGGTQEEIDECSKEIHETLDKIIEEYQNQDDGVNIEGLIDPSEKYCNIKMHKVWMTLFFISLAVNLVGVGLLIAKIIIKKKKEGDDVPLVNYNIEEDGE